MRKTVRHQAVVLAGIAAALWIIHGSKGLMLAWFGISLEDYGIQPRSVHGLIGIAAAPLLHENARHLAGNWGPLLGLGWLVMWEGMDRFWKVTLGIAFLSGAAVWVLGIHGDNYIGSSGVAYGYLGYIMMRAWVRRRGQWLVAAGLGVFLFGGLFYTWFTWRSGVSLLGHVAGFLAGMVCASIAWRPKPLMV